MYGQKLAHLLEVDKSLVLQPRVTGLIIYSPAPVHGMGPCSICGFSDDVARTLKIFMHIKGRLLKQGVFLFKCFPFQTVDYLKPIKRHL